MPDVKKRYRLIACEVMFREICLCAAQCRDIIDISFMEQGYHAIGDEKMRKKLQAEIDRIHAEDYDAILLCYGLCSNGTQGLRAGVPIVIPRAHDCITLLMGSKEAYREYFFANPGTFFLSSGWLERDARGYEEGFAQQSVHGKDLSYYTALYDEETAKYLMETLGDPTANYKKIAFIHTGTGAGSEDRESARGMAAEKDWAFEEITGNTSLIAGLLSGNWDAEKYLVVNPGDTIAPSYDDGVVAAEKVTRD
ncbi:MAG: DUF1638 domain-containing protein [Peptococcaceae bacterium]|jgi:hypothetical protein|nr:DUF1638 domain-containing protein [Peptococcaceae bacterium]